MTKPDRNVAVVTGAGQGIGRAIAQRLHENGAIVIATDINKDAALAMAADLGGDSIGLHADVVDRNSVNQMVSQVMDRFNRIDILVNNAGWDKAEPFVDSEPEVWDRIIRVNLYGVLNTSSIIMPIMAQQKSGRVVNLGSDAGRVGSSGEAVYSAAKGGVIAFTKAMAREMARSQVAVNCVCPGPTDTELFANIGGEKLRGALTKAIPLRRLGQPVDVANAVAFLASKEAAFITGQTLSVSGGLTMA